MFGPSTLGMAKRVERIDDATAFPSTWPAPFATAMNGRPGPVVLVLPEDMLTAALVPQPVGRTAAAAGRGPGAGLERPRRPARPARAAAGSSSVPW